MGPKYDPILTEIKACTRGLGSKAIREHSFVNSYNYKKTFVDRLLFIKRIKTIYLFTKLCFMWN